MFCGKCGCHVPDDDLFCSHCGARVNKVTHQQPSAAQPAASVPAAAAPVQASIPGAASLEEALLEVICISANPSASITIKSVNLGNIKVKPGEDYPIRVPIGVVNLQFHVDRGPGLTWVAPRHTNYQKSLVFHPGERIIMQVNIGRNMTKTIFQSSLGYVII